MARSSDGFVPPTECPCRYDADPAYIAFSRSWSQTPPTIRIRSSLSASACSRRSCSLGYGTEPTTTSGSFAALRR
jgi:hypothetical protein